MEDDKSRVPVVTDKTEAPIVGHEEKSPSDVTGKTEVDKSSLTTDKQPNVTPVFNVEASHKELLDRYNRQEKSYKELQKHATQQSMRASELEKKLDQVLSTLAKATEAEIDPQQFIRDVNEKGHRPILDLITKEIDKVKETLKSEHGKVTGAQESRILQLEAELTMERMSRDVKNFPGFDELKQTFGEILDDPNCPIRQDLPIPDQLAALYTLAKNRSADQAVILAKEQGKKETLEELAKESKTTIAGGGKTAGTTEPDWDNIPLDKHRKMLIDTFGIRE